MATRQRMIDVTPKVGVSIQIRSDGKVVWVDVDGVCALRACNIKYLEVHDDRPRRQRGATRKADKSDG